MSNSAVVNRIGLWFLHVGGLVGLVGAWLNANTDPSDGADIGGAGLILLGTLGFLIGLVLELVGVAMGRSPRHTPHGRS